MPPDYLTPSIMSVEQAVNATYKEYPQLRDKDVEEIYVQFKDFYQKLAMDKEMFEPVSTKATRQALIDAILKALDIREEIGADDHYIMNERYTLGGRPIHCLEALYAAGFNHLIRSVRFWRKERGQTGYLDYIREFLPG
jgi:hypothetical protein